MFFDFEARLIKMYSPETNQVRSPMVIRLFPHLLFVARRRTKAWTLVAVFPSPLRRSHLGQVLFSFGSLRRAGDEAGLPIRYSAVFSSAALATV